MFRSLITLLLFTGLVSPPLPVQDTEFLPADNTYPIEDFLKIEKIPKKETKTALPIIEASSALLMDLNTGIFLYEKDTDKKLPMASLTKIMTAIIIMESHDPDEVVMVEDDLDAMGELGVRMWLHQYEKITVENLLAGLLIRSAGDAAMALARYDSGSIEDFVEKMNKRAVELGLKNTKFTNPIGLDNKDHYSTAYDLAILTKYALNNKRFRNLIRIPGMVVMSADGKFKHEIFSTNELLNSYLNIQGVKTGTTDDAGQSLINLARHWNGKEVITVLLNSPDRFQESKRLIDWGFRNFKW